MKRAWKCIKIGILRQPASKATAATIRFLELQHNCSILIFPGTFPLYCQMSNNVDVLLFRCQVFFCIIRFWCPGSPFGSLFIWGSVQIVPFFFFFSSSFCYSPTAVSRRSLHFRVFISYNLKFQYSTFYNYFFFFF